MATFVNTPNETKYKFYPARGEEFSFNVCCANDCTVGLSTQPRDNNPMYEIVIGGWNNTKSVIHQIGKSPQLNRATTPGIVNANEMRSFWIRWHDKVIRVGRKGEDVPFMSYKEPKLFAVKYVAIFTAYGSTGSWLFADPTVVNGSMVPYDGEKGDYAGIENVKFVKTPNEIKYRFYPAHGELFTFSVCCTTDCTVGLSALPQDNNPMYEVIIGGWNNTQSSIRKIGPTTPYFIFVSTPAIVNGNEMRSFWIRWHDKVIRVGRKGDNVPFMSYKEPNLFAIKYVGIYTAYGSTGSWLLDGETPALDVVPASTKDMKMVFSESESMASVNTPDDMKYIFYPARGKVFTFRVQCKNDCHVALSTKPQEALHLYEIFLGGWNNTKSVIRQIGKEPALVEAPSPGIVSATEMRGFWISWYDNVIRVGCESEHVPFMTFKDPHMYPVRYVGVRTAFGSDGSWLFDEKTPNETKYKFYAAYGEIFTFKVCCSNDCTVGLTSQPRHGDPMYEIIIGGWNNTKSAIRRFGKTPHLIEVATPGILNANEMRGFWICWHDNVICVGREGETVPFMLYKDPKLFPLEYVAIFTAYGATGTWLLDETANVDVVPLPPKVRDVGFTGSETFTSVNTPNEKKYIFYPVQGQVFKFKVQCSNDCHVALSTQPQELLPFYEFGIGGWNNTKSVMRKFGNKADVVLSYTPGVVSAQEMRGFWICWHDNIICVGREGEDVPFMHHKDLNLFPIKYVGICTAFGSSGSWLLEESAPYDAVPISLPVLTKPSIVVKTPPEKSYKFYPAHGEGFNFKVCCSHDCHVALSAQPLQGLPMYEVVLGGRNNSKSVIRQMGVEPPEVAEASTPGIVHVEELRGFWIRWHDNVISVGREGEEKSFMSHKDPQLFPIKYVGISTGNGATGSWSLDGE